MSAFTRGWRSTLRVQGNSTAAPSGKEITACEELDNVLGKYFTFFFFFFSSQVGNCEYLYLFSQISVSVFFLVLFCFESVL